MNYAIILANNVMTYHKKMYNRLTHCTLIVLYNYIIT